MTDTQWPRFQVFLQEKEDLPHQDVGSVHAPDIEMALLNARDVFVRRPECTSLWVVPAGAIFSRTAEELAAQGVESIRQGDEEQKPAEDYYVFCKEKAAGTQAYAGTVQAAAPGLALQVGIQEFQRPKPAYAWLVFPTRLVFESTPGERESFFTPALDKPFRLSTDFHTVSAMRRINTSEKPAGQAKKQGQAANVEDPSGR